MVYSYPSFPTYYGGNLGTFLLQLLTWIISVPLIAAANFFISIIGSATTAGQNSTSSVIGFIGATWNNSLQAFSSLGIFAPVIASLIWGFSVLILIFFIFKAIQLGAHETEEN
jgi:hypothetical protein